MTPDSIGHVEGGEYRGPEGFRQIREMFPSALPDVHIDVEDMISDGDRAAIRWRARGTHTPAMASASRRRTSASMSAALPGWSSMATRIVEGWDTWNLEGMLSSLRAAAEKARA
jgi:predicted ester cyclase